MSRLRVPVVVIVTTGLALLGGAAPAAVIEPNGTAVPATVNNGETTLQKFFTTRGENIDAVADAAITRATFQPLCNFEATPVLRQSGAGAGLAWYNVPPDATA